VKLSPQKANTLKKLCSLNRDNKALKNYWILVEESTVTLCKQTAGSVAEQHVTIDKRAFDNLIAFYQAEQEIKEPTHD
jgi:hypothetical protein